MLHFHGIENLENKVAGSRFSGVLTPFELLICGFLIINDYEPAGMT